MADQSRKRARTASSTDKPKSVTEASRAAQLPALLATLDNKTVQDILLHVATRDSKVATLIEDKATRIRKAEQAKVINFDSHSKTVWKTINVTYSRLSGSKQFEASGEAFRGILTKIKDIRDRSPAHANLSTKVNALETLRKIGKTIALSAGDTMAREIRLSFQRNSILEDTMMGIVQSMTAEERETTSYEPHEDVTWIEKLEELKGIADGYSLFESLDEVLELLAPGSGDGDVEEEENDDVKEV